MVKKLFRWFIVSAVLVICLSGFTVYSAPLSSGGSVERTQVKNPVKVVCENGVMLGQSEEGVVSFKGIPFAKPPVGKLRWKAPQAPDPSGDEIKCYDFGYTALQYEWDSEPASYSPKNEDCLTLNIWENVFNNLKEDIYAGEVDPRTAAKVQESWVNFARTGDPSVKGAGWKKYNTRTRDTMVIEKDKWKCVSDPSKKARELLKKAYGDEPYYVW